MVFHFDSPLSEEPRCQIDAPDAGAQNMISKDVAMGIGDE
jgi:hypothetical protein